MHSNPHSRNCWSRIWKGASWISIDRRQRLLLHWQPSVNANLEALAVVDDPSTALKHMNAITDPKRTPAGQSVKAFNPLSMADQRSFKALLAGANTIHGFRNRDIRARLAGSPFMQPCGRSAAKQSAKVSRLLKRFHIYGLIAKVPRTRRWRLSNKGWALLSAAVSLKEQTFPALYKQASA